ncbi:conserved hypothetical protein [Mesorhizobium sp. STM 4661]|nr:conserved hypothetical protein [Mesorhizobium sp. STM 4661]
MGEFSVDNQSTGSISDGASTVRNLLNPSDEAQKPATFGSDRNLFGR